MRGQVLANRRRALSLENMNSSFLTYCHGRYLKVGVISAVLSILVYNVYYAYAPMAVPSGGTPLGLIYGGIATAAILLLMGYSLRKRSYSSRLGMLQGWLSAHFYIGLLTLLWVPLHSGFRFGTNVHTLAYLCLVIVVLSGLFGAYMFFVKPRQFAQFGAEVIVPGDVVDRDHIDRQMNRTMRKIEALSQDKSQVFRQLCETEMAEGWPGWWRGWQILFQRGLSRDVTPLGTLQRYLPEIPADHHADFTQFMVLAKRKRDLQYQLATQMRLKNWLQVWRYVHLPVSVVMLAVIVFHIVLVLRY